jgi:cyclic beta-1,2-glucan synthetase
MAAVDRLLVRRDAGLIQLLEPPFDKSALEPGYIKGYLPGVRENGGQYTHGAIWAAMAFALLGDRERAWELFRMLNPAHHASTGEDAARYHVEPYVMPADIYAAPPHLGRGGWTWYTGSAGWMYRLAVETLLGLHREGTKLRLAPNIPDGWQGFRAHYRFRQTHYHLDFRKTAGGQERALRIVLDGTVQPDNTIPLTDDQREHHVEIELV